MMSPIDLQNWLDLMLQKLLHAFGNRLLFVGHVGSWVRGEARPDSDIDLNVILDRVDSQDIELYRKIVQEMPRSELACGFLGSRAEIQAWPRHELFHFLQGCKILHGTPENLVPQPTSEHIREYIRISTSTLLHETRHRMIYGRDPSQEVQDLALAYKCSFFVLQAWLALTHDRFFLTKKEVADRIANPLDKEILQRCMNWHQDGEDRKERPLYYFDLLARWSSNMLLRLENRSCLNES